MRRDREHWALVAEQWATWVRRPGHDIYPLFSDAFFENIVPPPGKTTLEVGCGEGRISRDLKARQHRVVGVDVVPALVRLAKQSDPSVTYIVGDAPELPFSDGEFDLVVAFNSLMDIDDMPAALRELGRVTARRGRLCIRVTHPIADAGAFQSMDADAAFVINSDYLATRRFEGSEERDSLKMTFAGWAYPFQSYFQALEEAGFLIERVREPQPAKRWLEQDAANTRW